MQKLVIDSSVIVKWLNKEDEERLNQADKILEDVKKNQATLLAPELAKYEIGNALLVRKRISANEAKVNFSTLFTFPIQFISQSEELANETYLIAQNASITYYDACFIALAKQEDAELITDNPKHQGKSSEVRVKSLTEY